MIFPGFPMVFLRLSIAKDPQGLKLDTSPSNVGTQSPPVFSTAARVGGHRAATRRSLEGNIPSMAADTLKP